MIGALRDDDVAEPGRDGDRTRGAPEGLLSSTKVLADRESRRPGIDGPLTQCSGKNYPLARITDAVSTPADGVGRGHELSKSKPSGAVVE